MDTKEKETALERCEFELQARADQTKCRLLVRMICRHGVVKTYKLIYEPTNVLRANFDTGGSPNYWTTPARTLRDIVEYFGAKTDQLDWSFEKGKVNFTTYTEKITDGRDIFKQPMHTSVAIERKDFDDFSVQEGLHIGIVVRDFRAIVSHADGLGVSITARYSRGNRPMQIAYESDGILGEFTLMTRGQNTSMPSVGGTRTSTPARDLSVRPAQRPQLQKADQQQVDRDPTPTLSATIMPPPIETASFKGTKGPPQPTQYMTSTTRAHEASRIGSPPAPSASLDQHSLFFPAGEEEHFWDEHDNDTTEQEDFVTWDASGRGSVLSEAGRRIRDSESATSFQGPRPIRREVPNVQGIAPTQRLSQLKGLFD
jgi:cell cycle checkpoint control protein RAD9A